VIFPYKIADEIQTKHKFDENSTQNKKTEKFIENKKN
jgi:hypothetical protein